MAGLGWPLVFEGVWRSEGLAALLPSFCASGGEACSSFRCTPNPSFILAAGLLKGVDWSPVVDGAVSSLTGLGSEDPPLASLEGDFGLSGSTQG